MTTRRRLVLWIALVFARPVLAQDKEGAGLMRLAAVLEKQLSRRKDALPLPWKESILAPATSRLVWYPRRVAVRSGADTFRIAFDPLTRWYFVVQVSVGSERPRYFGPLEETARGHFVESFGAPPTPDRALGTKRARP